MIHALLTLESVAIRFLLSFVFLVALRTADVYRR